ncbi:endonuclease Q family protein [Peribacillus deserti]|uniref:TIGR00375 family protein n=1 Tax=Peribacillus deserti TaxID=673318 RepID=A0A2N5M1M9_9BACI|nr:endonuclease Q family protein [Peribacillus deserti]PLT28259.1 TIGR00375 family protein [Peribacillus deserti]
MNTYYADLHIHIGRTKSGQAVKITGAKSLTLATILETANYRKGLDIIGIIDSHSPEVIEEMEEMINSGSLTELNGGGLQYRDLVLIPGSEIEIYDENCKGPIHVLAYFPDLDAMKQFSSWMEQHLKNIRLSSQRIYVNAVILQQKVKELRGLFIPAHVFTPFKSLFGKGVSKSLQEVFDPDLIDGIELGLSSDTYMAEGMKELNPYVFLTNSDAHSLGKIAREYQALELAEPSFEEFSLALKEQEGRRVATNYGLNPLLGKYHETVCSKCHEKVTAHKESCSCGGTVFIKGVASRIEELKSYFPNPVPRKRPPYIHQVPLEFIPGLGPKLMEKLLDAFGTEMGILHRAGAADLKNVVPEKIAEYIDLARKGQLLIEAGGGGRYGRVRNLNQQRE